MTPESGDDVPSCCVRGTEVPTRPWGVLKDAASFRTRCRRVGTSVPHNQTIHECIASTVPLTSVRSRVSRSAASPSQAPVIKASPITGVPHRMERSPSYVWSVRHRNVWSVRHRNVWSVRHRNVWSVRHRNVWSVRHRMCGAFAIVMCGAFAIVMCGAFAIVCYEGLKSLLGRGAS